MAVYANGIITPEAPPLGELDAKRPERASHLKGETGMKIIVDMMGGDNAPLAVLEGTAQAVKEYGVQILGVVTKAVCHFLRKENH